MNSVHLSTRMTKTEKRTEIKRVQYGLEYLGTNDVTFMIPAIPRSPNYKFQ